MGRSSFLVNQVFTPVSNDWEDCRLATYHGDEGLMQKELSIICIEDVPADVAMLNHALRDGGLSFRSKRVETQEAFLHELEHNPPDVILSDHGLPSFDGFMALTLAREKCPEVPFIFVTGKLGEQIAIETLKNGATDYVLKSNLAKLAPTIERALREAGERAALKQEKLQLRESEERYRQLVEFCPDAILVQCEGEIVFANRAAAHLFAAADARRLVGKPIREIIHSESLPALETRFHHLIQTGVIFFWRKMEKGWSGKQNEPGAEIAFTEEKFVRLGGASVAVEVAATPLLFQGRPAIQIIAHDTPARRRAGGALATSEEIHRQSPECSPDPSLDFVRLLLNAPHYRQLVQYYPDAVIVVYDDDGLAFANLAAVKLLGARDAAELVGKPAAEIFRSDPWDLMMDRFRKLRNEEVFVPFFEQAISRPDGTTCEVEVSAAPIAFEDRSALQVIVRSIGGRARG
jgi:PAS domain S-box-containing protein